MFILSLRGISRVQRPGKVRCYREQVNGWKLPVQIWELPYRRRLQINCGVKNSITLTSSGKRFWLAVVEVPELMSQFKRANQTIIRGGNVPISIPSEHVGNRFKIHYRADTPCVQLGADMRCKIFLSPLRPKVCASLQASMEMCGTTRQQAMDYLIYFEAAVAP